MSEVYSSLFMWKAAAVNTLTQLRSGRARSSSGQSGGRQAPGLPHCPQYYMYRGTGLVSGQSDRGEFNGNGEMKKNGKMGPWGRHTKKSQVWTRDLNAPCRNSK